MKPIILTVVLCLIATQGMSQSRTDVPDRNYFQQHVHYRLNGTMLDDPRSPHLQGEGSLEYTNNSPDTLFEVYFHLYWNLFKHGSYGERAPNRDHSEDESYDLEGITIQKFGELVGSESVDDLSAIEIDNTIMRLRLRHPIAPHESRTFTFSWIGELPNYGIRSTWGYHDGESRNFATAQWYPQICVYDEHGWHPDQYIGMGEFYTDYGMYDVELHLPKSFSTVISTGWQTNPEILTKNVCDQLAYARSHSGELVRISDHGNDRQELPGHDSLVTWKFHADSVRDFAWVADEAYIWDVIYENGTMHNALFWQNSRAFWGRDAAKIARHTVQFNSKLAGQYIYPNLYMCETYEGGMEYPGIVFIGPYLDGEQDHDAQNTMMHEIGHQWYPMMMGSNETDYGYMDEGFNTFITTLAHEAWFGRYNNSYGPNEPYQDDERTSNYRWAWHVEMSGESDPPETKADMFRDYHTYAEATYGKTGAIFFMLRYTMGDSAFSHFLHLYYDRWHTKHPYPEDLRAAAEDIERTEGDTSRVRAHGDLRWFFDEWFRTTWKLDYAVDGFSVNGTTAEVTIGRRERGVMPIDLVFTFDDGTAERRWIPVDDWLRTVAISRTYTFTFTKHPTHVEINPTNELLESNRLNNTSSWLPPMDVSLMPKYRGEIKPLDDYAIRSAPFAAAQTYGWTLLGSYMERSDRFALGLRVNAPFGGQPTRVGGVLQYHTILDAFSPTTTIDLAASSVGTYLFGGLKFNQVFTGAVGEWPHQTLMVGYDISQPNTLTLPLNRFEFGYTFDVRGATSRFTSAIDVEAGLSDPRTTYSKVAAVIGVQQDFGEDWEGLLRFFGGEAEPASGGTVPIETAYRLGSPSRLESYMDDYTSNFASAENSKIRNAATSGALVRGYMLEGNPFGTSAASGQFELSNSSLFPFGFLRLIPILGTLFRYTGLTIFGDAGFVTNQIASGDVHDIMRYDYGAGLNLVAGRSFWQNMGIDLSRTELQLDFPFYLSNPVSDPKYKFREELFVRQNF